jgi:hypothetical protein
MPFWKSVEDIRKELIDNCLFARQRFFENRGLPLYALAFYGASKTSSLISGALRGTGGLKVFGPSPGFHLCSFASTSGCAL